MKENEKQEKTGLNADAVMKEVLKEKKAKLFATISEYVEDKTKVGELQQIINDALDSAYSLGEMSETAITKGDEIIASMGNLFNSYLNPHNAKYKQLYDNQRMTTDCLLQALRIQQVQLTLKEENPSSTMDILSLIGTAASFAKVNPGENTFIEKENKE